MTDLSYHDVVCIFDGQRVRIKDNYAYKLTCTRAGGWNLWWEREGKSELIAGEHDYPKLEIEVNGIKVL